MGLACQKLFKKLKIKQINVIGFCWEVGPNALTLFESVLGLAWALGLAAKPDPTAFSREGNAPSS
jgi:hypothetical protein